MSEHSSIGQLHDASTDMHDYQWEDYWIPVGVQYMFSWIPVGIQRNVPPRFLIHHRAKAVSAIRIEQVSQVPRFGSTSSRCLQLHVDAIRIKYVSSYAIIHLGSYNRA